MSKQTSTDVCLDCHGRGEIDGPDRKVYGGKGERGWIEPTAIKCERCDGTGEVAHIHEFDELDCNDRWMCACGLYAGGN